MSDIRKLIDTINEMATTSGSVATVAQPMGGTQRRTKQSKDSIFYEGDAVCHTCHQHECQCDANSRKAPESPEVSNFGLWKNSILAGKEQKAKKKAKVKESVTDYNPPSQGGTRKELLAKLKAAKSKDEKSDLATRARKAGASQRELQAVSESEGYQGQYASKDEAIAYAKEKVKKFRDPDDGIEIWAMPGGRFDVVHTMNSAGRNHVIDNGGKKLGTISARDRVDELGNSLMPGGQRALRLAQETFVDPRASRRHPGATDVAEDGQTAGAKKMFSVSVGNRYNIKAATEEAARQQVEPLLPSDATILDVKLVSQGVAEGEGFSDMWKKNTKKKPKSDATPGGFADMEKKNKEHQTAQQKKKKDVAEGTEKEYHVINHRGTPTVVSPSGKMNKNFSSTYDAQQFAKKKNAEIGKKKDVAEDTASVKYGVFSKGGSVGDQKWKNDPIKTFDNKEEAIAFAKHRRAGLSKGEKAYYRMSYVVKPIKNTTEKQVNEHGDPWEDPDYDPRGGGETRSPEQIEKDNAEHAILSKKLGLKNTNNLPDMKDDMLKMMNHFMYDERKKKK